MQNTALKIPASGRAWQETAVVTAIDGDKVVVETSDGTFRAKQAAGCLVAPEVTDLVLLALTEESCWVLSVLERGTTAATRLVVDGDLQLELRTGRLGVTAQEGVEIAAGAPVSVVAPAFDVHAQEGELAVDRLSLLAGTVDVDASKARVVVAAVEQVVDRLTQRVKRAYRFIEEVDQLRAGGIDYVAKKLLELHGENAAVTAKELVKVDGAQIHVG